MCEFDHNLEGIGWLKRTLRLKKWFMNYINDQVRLRSWAWCRNIAERPWYVILFTRDLFTIGRSCFQFPFPQTSLISSIRPSSNRTTIFKLILIVREIELQSSHEETKINKRTLNLGLNARVISVSLRSTLGICLCQQTMLVNKDFN